MNARCARATIPWVAIVLAVIFPHGLSAQRKIPCPDGDHYEIDLKQVSLQYSASSFSATLNGLGLLGSRIQIDQKKLQEAAASTQQWNEYLKGLAIGFNVCAITSQQYNDGVSRIYPRLQKDVADLESFRKLIADGRKADEKRIPALIDSYLSNLREFRQMTAQGDDVRHRGLALSSQIMDFLTERQSRDQGCGPTPNSYVVFGNLPQDGLTSSCMREARRAFVDKFEASIANLHDEFSRRGLQDPILDSMYQHLPAISGDVDEAIRQIADSIRRLARLVPPVDLYSDLSDASLASVAVDEVHSIDEKLKAAMKALEHSPESPDAIRYSFFWDFEKCCLNQVEYLRAELLKRLGPSAYDTDEMFAFNGFRSSFTEMATQPTSSIATALAYAPHFRKLAFKLKRRGNPLRGPQSLPFAETTTPSEKKDFLYRTVITIESSEEFRSGYVVVVLERGAGIIQTDLDDADILFDRREIIDNRQLSELLMEQNPEKVTFAFKIGKTPVYKNLPVHVVTHGNKEIHVRGVWYFEE